MLLLGVGKRLMVCQARLLMKASRVIGRGVGSAIGRVTEGTAMPTHVEVGAATPAAKEAKSGSGSAAEGVTSGTSTLAAII
jgi:hypothetical protein